MSELATQLHPDTNRRLDAIDRKILMVLQEDASLSVAEIGDRVGLSSTPCWKRIQRLEADGVILRRVALVDQNKIGLGISVFVSVESADHSETWLKKFAEAVSAMPEVMEFYRMAGDVDYMLRVVVADMQSYDVFYKKLISAVPLKNVTSRFAMEKIKSVTALPVPARRNDIWFGAWKHFKVGASPRLIDIRHVQPTHRPDRRRLWHVRRPSRRVAGKRAAPDLDRGRAFGSKSE